jgi:predicted metal-dependent enzyme (double-stranded beta helix superfamily)
MTETYTIDRFFRDAKDIMADAVALEQKQRAIGECLNLLTKRDDLLGQGERLGPTDACTDTFRLRQEGTFSLSLAQFDPGYTSPVHGHGTHWVVGCVYRGADRWRIYERLDDGSREGFADLKKVEELTLHPGEYTSMPPPPRSIHSHSNQAAGDTYELIFSSAEIDWPARLIYDVEAGTCRPTSWAGLPREFRSSGQAHTTAQGGRIPLLFRPHLCCG